MLGAYLHSFIFAKVLGLYMIVMSIVYLTRADYYRKVVDNLSNEGVAVMTAATFSLIFGLLLVIVHNFWAWQPFVVITVIAWLIVIKSILWLAIPEGMARMTQKMLSGNMLYVSAVINAAIGVWILSYASASVILVE